MADYTYEDLKSKTVAQLREIAAGIKHPAVTGATQMRKDEVIDAICRALDIDQAKHVEVVGIDKKAIKQQIKDLKQKRQAALEAKDGETLSKVRRKIHRLKRTMRRHMVS